MVQPRHNFAAIIQIINLIKENEMKKLAILILMMLVSAASFSQTEDNESKERFGIGLMMGANGIYDDMPTPVFGVNFFVWNVYTDLMFWSPSHTNDVGVQEWHDEKSAFMIHFGYEFTPFKHFGIVPVIGYSKSTRGFTDGHDWSVTSSGRIENTYNVTDKVDGFDYGAILAYRVKHWQLLVSGTRYSIYTGAAYMF